MTYIELMGKLDILIGVISDLKYEMNLLRQRMEIIEYGRKSVQQEVVKGEEEGQGGR